MERVDTQLSVSVKRTVCETEGVIGAYDLVMTNYGPDRWLASVHISVPDTWTADKIDRVSREIAENVAAKNHVLITAVGIYSHNTLNEEIVEIRRTITEMAVTEKYVLQLHGFFCDMQEKSIRFDLVIDFEAPDPDGLIEKLKEKINSVYPDYTISILRDTDVSD